MHIVTAINTLEVSNPPQGQLYGLVPREISNFVHNLHKFFEKIFSGALHLIVMHKELDERIICSLLSQ